MQNHSLKRTHKNPRKRYVGRGGRRGKTSGRGTKGQKARAGRKLRPELRELIKKLPKLRGRGVNSFKSFAPKVSVVPLSVLEEQFSSGERVSLKTLREKGVLSLRDGRSVKVVATGSLSKPLLLEGLRVSLGARKSIEEKGGSVS